MVGTLLEFDRFLVILGYILPPFWVIFGSFWLLLVPFGLPRASQGRLPNLVPFLVHFWSPF